MVCVHQCITACEFLLESLVKLFPLTCQDFYQLLNIESVINSVSAASGQLGLQLKSLLFFFFEQVDKSSSVRRCDLKCKSIHGLIRVHNSSHSVTFLPFCSLSTVLKWFKIVLIVLYFLKVLPENQGWVVFFFG